MKGSKSISVMLPGSHVVFQCSLSSSVSTTTGSGVVVPWIIQCMHIHRQSRGLPVPSIIQPQTVVLQCPRPSNVCTTTDSGVQCPRPSSVCTSTDSGVAVPATI
ncbi:hypothetical protein ElyMa_005822000 [Elysia marginata]|uniref:Ig-like domain-containing protein n=1 Tax=Elysia marginata TaxID=1093978 RepID=A0AAV4FX90_9GAST|nr:hypothetical protein ElyMa_005822000 [Elysia marginata]